MSPYPTDDDNRPWRIGQAQIRLEDDRLVTGQGRFVEDLRIDGLCHAYFIRSVHAHADIAALDVEAARSAPGVLAVLTAQDYLAAGLGQLPYIQPIAPGWDLDALHAARRIPLAESRVRHVGDPVCVIVAETINAAKDAADLIMIDYVPLAHVTETGAAADPQSPQIWDDCPNNVMFRHEKGDKAATEAAFENAARIISDDMVISRVSPNPIENRVVLAYHDDGDDLTTVHLAAQSAHSMRRFLAEGYIQRTAGTVSRHC